MVWKLYFTLSFLLTTLCIILFTMYILQTHHEMVKQDKEIQRLKTSIDNKTVKNEQHIIFWGDPEPRLDNVLWVWYEWYLKEPDYNVEWCTTETSTTSWTNTTIISNNPQVPVKDDCIYYLLGLPDHFPSLHENAFYITDQPAPSHAIPTPYGKYLDQCLYVDTLYQTRSFTHEYKAEKKYILQWPGMDAKALCSLMQINSQVIHPNTNVETVRFLTERAAWIPLLDKSKYALWTIQQKKALVTTDLYTFRQFGEQGLYHPSLESLQTKMMLLSTNQEKIWTEKLKTFYQHISYPKWLSFVPNILNKSTLSFKIVVDDEKDRDLMIHMLKDLGLSEDEQSGTVWYRVKDGSRRPSPDTKTIVWFTPESALDWSLFPSQWTYVMGHDTVRTEWIENGSPGCYCAWMIRPCEPFLSEKPYEKKKAMWKHKHPPRAQHIVCQSYPRLPFTSIIWKRIHHQATFWLPESLIPQANEWFDPAYSSWVKTYKEHEKPWEVMQPIWATADLYHQAVRQWDLVFRQMSNLLPNQTV